MLIGQKIKGNRGRLILRHWPGKRGFHGLELPASEDHTPLSDVLTVTALGLFLGVIFWVSVFAEAFEPALE